MTEPVPAGERSPFERALELLLYAPLGLVSTAREELPRLIDKGRREAGGQVGTARVVGEFAVNKGQQEAGRLLRQVAERLADLGLVPDPRPRPAPPPETAPPPPAEPAAAAADPPVEAPPAPANGTLAIPGYDSLSAPQVVQRLDGLSAAELEAVRAYEAGTRGRKTILSRIAQLQSGA